ncbi:YecA family protein [Bacillus sp. SJS]|uniref:YecA family protein n=1 Tax=Bacillus sp. SJS TaxID=1423321 RepID=UPI0009EF38D9|nr:SEC-C domain-containing protein [Bacillus sp. SJS]
MSINRNAPCPCGSGKKYKKCCLSKENVVQLNEVKQDRFLQQKEELVLRVSRFFQEHYNHAEIHTFRQEFRERTRNTVPRHIEDSFFEFYLYFLRKTENGKRPIEWFYEENHIHLTTDQETMLRTWISLNPRLLQAIDRSEHSVLFEDQFTGETFPVPRSPENTGEFIPWYGTLSMLEPFENQYLFNGLRAFTTPQGIRAAVSMTKELMEKENLPHEEVLLHYFPELMAEIVQKESEKSGDQSKVIEQIEVTYKVLNDEALLEFFHHNDEFLINEWAEEKSASWTGGWKTFTDSEMKGSALLGDVYGTIEVRKGILSFTCIGSDHAEAFKHTMKKTGVALSYMDQSSKAITIPFHAEISNMVFHSEEASPEQFAPIAQAFLNMDLDQKIPAYDNLSLKEMCKEGREADAEHWLKNYEHNYSKQMEDGDLTPDFNTIRRELGLPLSPFVTGGEKRTSALTPASPPGKKSGSLVQQEDIPFYEALGFRPDTIHSFYASDLMNFYREKSMGKSENTVRKYRNNLLDLREILEGKSLTSWSDCSQTFWNDVFGKDLFALYTQTSKTQLKEFASTMKTLAKWLDDRNGTNLSEDVAKAITETEFV